MLDRLDELTLPDGHLAAGCLFQTVWNVLDGQDPQHGIGDYDVIYFDDADLSWDAEDEVIQRCATAFADLPIEVEVRNQARVHLWYEDHFGVPYSPLRSCTEAIDRYAAQACRYGIHPEDGSWSVYAPVGYDDLFAMVVRPNPVVAPREVYQAKAARWQALWPRLRILD
ncbi:MAG TPA: nucleotidyltransferase family protein, partial [Acidimicrobiales bacterium]